MNKITDKQALELAILEYEKDLELDKNNQLIKDVLKGLKECKQDLEKLEKAIDILKEVLNKDLVIKFGETIDNSGCVYISKINCNNSIVYIGKEECSLLKEVLENEK